MKKTFAALLISFIASGKAIANFACVGKIDEVAIRHSGGVSIISQEMWNNHSVGRDICNIETEWNGVSIATCKGWLSQVLAAKAGGTTISITYTNDAYSCESMPTWKNAIQPHAVSNN